MGLQWRKRTKDAKSWWNFSSSKRGLGASFSFKMGDITANFGTGGRRRITMKLGNGFRYVKTATIKPKPKAITSSKPIVSTNELIDSLETLNRKLEPLDMDKWTGKQQLVFVLIVFIVCLVVQLSMR